MRLNILLLSLFLFCRVTTTLAQNEDQNPISVSDIKSDLTNIDNIRAVLLERGFKLQSKKQEGTHLHEYWFIPDPECPTICSLATFQINRNTSENMTYCSFSYSVRKSKRPNYLYAMKQDVMQNLPLKRVQDVERITKASNSDEEETHTNYNLVYYSSNNKIVVSPDDDGNWAGYDYSLSTFRNVSKAKSVNRSAHKK